MMELFNYIYLKTNTSTIALARLFSEKDNPYVVVLPLQKPHLLCKNKTRSVLVEWQKVFWINYLRQSINAAHTKKRT